MYDCMIIFIHAITDCKTIFIRKTSFSNENQLARITEVFVKCETCDMRSFIAYGTYKYYVISGIDRVSEGDAGFHLRDDLGFRSP